MDTGAYEGILCDFGNLCYDVGQCSGGVCSSTNTITCPDATSCDISYCSPTLGCLYLNNSDCHECVVDDDCPYIPCKQASCNVDVCEYTANDSAVEGCNDDVFCNGEEICSKGTCILGIAPVCDDQNDCTTDACDDTIGNCTNTPVAVNSSCTSMDLCALDTQCNALGECIVLERMTCSFYEPCRISQGCNALTGGCASIVYEDGTPCVANDPCAAPGVCTNGVCTYDTVVNCSQEGFCSQLYECNRQTGECEGYGVVPVACSDDSACTLGDYCASNGTCIQGEYDACEFTLYDEQCQYVTCEQDDDDNIGCSVTDYEDNTTCSTGMPSGVCSGEDLCLSGMCTRTYAYGELCRPADSSGCDVDDYCGPEDDYCPEDNKEMNGTSCPSPFFCYTTGVCFEGECQGDSPYDCSFLDSPCTVGVCDEVNAVCVSENLPNNMACEPDELPCVEHSGCYFGYCLPYNSPTYVNCTDDNECTVGDHCSGVDDTCISGTEVDCSYLDSFCSTASCNITEGTCVVEFINDGLACNADDNFCTTNDTCHSGVCIAGDFLNCTRYDNECQRGTCTSNATCDVEVTGRECSPDYCSGNCTAPFEWWSVHSSRDSALFTWPNNMETQMLCGQNYYTWSQMPYKEYPWLLLFQQWLGATLNVENGACMANTTALVMQQVMPLLEECDVHTIYFTNTTATPYRELIAQVYAYNVGAAGPGLCDPRPCFNDPMATSKCLFVAHLLSAN